MLATAPFLPRALPAQQTPTLCPAPATLGLLLRFFDVGQGDATLLTTSDARHILIDGGPQPTRVLQLLTELGVDTIALVIASHNHLDHIGGLPAILGAIPVTNVMENGLPATTRVYANFVAALEKSGARVLRAEARELSVGATRIRVLPPGAQFRSQNLASVGAIATFGDFRVLFTGDAEERAIRSWLSQDLIAPVTVVKVGHHGARNGTTNDLVDATQPRLAVVSVGARNPYGHPNPSVLASWRAAPAQILRTDAHGTITVRGCADGSFSASTARPFANPVRP